ncbi:MAG: DNA polymerase III subunit delta [Olsenella sp.]|nr:DNA polymerase III subunit delta [Olsenella sp.]
MAETKSPLLRAYLIVGSDELKRQAAVARIKRYVDEGLVDFNLDELTASADMDPASLVASLDTMPFGPGPRLVIVHDAGKLPKAVSEALITYLDNPNPSSVLCLEAESLAKGTRLYKAVAKQDGKPIVECAAKKAWELPAYVAQLCQRTHGKRMGEAAAKELVGRVGESTVLLDAQVRTLAELVGDRPEITLADVEEHVARTAEVKPWEFLDAVSGRDARRALALYQSMTDPSQVALLTLLVGRIRELACARSLAARGEGASLARALGKQEWQVKNHLRWARGFSDGDLERALVEAAALERILKGTGDSDAAFVSYVARVCGA